MRDTSQRFDPRQEMRRDDFEIFHNQDTRLDAVDLHHHDFYEVYLFLRGRVEWRIEGRLYRPQPGDLLLISPMELHQVTVDPQAGPYERIVLWIGRRYLEGFGGGELARCFDGHTNRLHPPDIAPLRALLECILDERAGQGYAADLCAEGCLLQLMALLNRTAQQSRETGENSPLISRVLAYIHRHYPEELSLDGLAGRFHVSKYYLSHEFSRQVGTSLYRYILLKRLQIAREMLLEGTAPTETAAACGFRDYPNFYRAFRARYDCGPRDCARSGGSLF